MLSDCNLTRRRKTAPALLLLLLSEVEANTPLLLTMGKTPLPSLNWILLKQELL